MSPRIHGISTKLERNNSFQKNISGAVINYTFTYIFLNSIFHILYLVPSSSNYTKPNRLQIYIFIRVPPYFRILYDIREGDNGEWRCFLQKKKLHSFRTEHLYIDERDYLAGVAAPASLLTHRVRGCNEIYHLK